MKKLIILLGLIFAVVAVQAQSTARTVTKTLNKGTTYYEYSGVSADTVGTGQDTLAIEFIINKNTPVSVAMRAEVTRTGTTDDYEMRLQGKVFENDAWTSIIDSTAQTGSLSLYEPDANMAKTQAASVDNFYRYFRFLIGSDGSVAAGDKLKLDKLIIKIYER